MGQDQIAEMVRKFVAAGNGDPKVSRATYEAEKLKYLRRWIRLRYGSAALEESEADWFTLLQNTTMTVLEEGKG